MTPYKPRWKNHYSTPIINKDSPKPFFWHPLPGKGRSQMERALVLITLLIFIHRLAVAQLPIPVKYDGFTYKGSPVLGESVLVEAFFDPLCPDSRDSWPPLKKALQFYNPRVLLIVHPFPLPYHSNSFLGCRALHIANNLNSSYTYPLLELFFEYQETFYNAPTYDLTRASIVDGMVQLATKAVGEKLKFSFRAGYNDSLTDSASRISFKYGCSRGVTGTPAFFVNGIPIPGSGSAIDYETWRSILDPLMVKQRD